MQSDTGYHFIADFLSCQQKFFWRYIKGLVPKTQSKSLLFGDAIHKALAEYYNAKWINGSWAERESNSIFTFRESLENSERLYNYVEDLENDISRGINLLNEYFIAYAHDPLASTAPEGIEAYKELSLKSGRVLTGNIDLIYDDKLYDHKTTGWSIPLAIRSLTMSNQSTTYLALTGKSAMVYNILYQKGRVCKFHREVIYRSQPAINRWLKQADEVLGKISDMVGKPADDWWRNDRACFSYNHICEYVSLCQSGYNSHTCSGFKNAEVDK